MASTSSLVPPPPDSLEGLKTSVYEACLPNYRKDPRYVVTQVFVEDLGILADESDLCLIVIQGLINDKLFKVVQDAEQVGWRLRTLEEAKKYRALTQEQEQVFYLIDEAGSDGMWSKTIKLRSNLHDAVFRSALKHLETKGLITDMKTVEFPNRKMYIKSSTRPSDRSTGGSWYTDSEMDEEFIKGICKTIVDFLWRRSFYHSSGKQPASSEKDRTKKSPKKGTINNARRTTDLTKAEKTEKALSLAGPVAAAVGGSVAERLDPGDPTLLEDDLALKRRRYENMLPMPPGYLDYPTLTDITSYIDSHPVTDVTLTEQEIEQLMEILIFDDITEKIDLNGAGGGYEETAYKATRRGLRQIILAEGNAGVEQNGFTGAPCGKCPVFELCELGGPVNPGGCEYFNDWLRA